MKQIIQDLKKYGGYILYASRSQLQAEVAQSKLNWIWWVLEPFCFMLIYSFVFGTLFGGTEQYHGLFIFVGLTIWQFFRGVVSHSVNIVRRKKSIIAKVYLPKYLLVLQEVFVDGFKLGINMILTVAMMIYYRVELGWQVIMIVPVALELGLLSFGIGCFMLHLGVFLDDMSNIVDIVMRMLVYFTGVYYSIPRRFDTPWNNLLVQWNPVAMLANCARNVLLYNQTPDYRMLFFWGIVSLVLAYAGIQLIRKNENTYVKVV